MFGVTENTLWVESFRPDTLDGYIGNEHIIDKVKIFIENGDVPHLLFYGGAGTGTAVTNDIKDIGQFISDNLGITLSITLSDATVATVAKVVRYVCNATSTYRTDNPSSSLKWTVDDPKYNYDHHDPKCLDTDNTGSPGCCKLSDYQKFVSKDGLRKVKWC